MTKNMASDHYMFWKCLNNHYMVNLIKVINAFPKHVMIRGHIFSHARPFYECPVRDLDRSMHRYL
jgi:hypothetical protein